MHNLSSWIPDLSPHPAPPWRSRWTCLCLLHTEPPILQPSDLTACSDLSRSVRVRPHVSLKADRSFNTPTEPDAAGHAKPTMRCGDWMCHVCGLHHKAKWVRCRKCGQSKFELRQLCKIGDRYSTMQPRKSQKRKDKDVKPTIKPDLPPLRQSQLCTVPHVRCHTRCHTCTKRD